MWRLVEYRLGQRTLVWSDCKLCRIVIALRLSVIKRTCNRNANKSNHPSYNPSLRYPPARDNSILPFMPSSPKWSLGISCHGHSCFTCHASHSASCDEMMIVILGKEYKLLSFLLCTSLRLTGISFLCENIHFNVLFSYTLNLCCSLRMRD
jgi:hypothetical protein